MRITNPILSFRYVESCRLTATKVRNYMDRRKAKVLMITAVMENEGKSTVAANIALSLAQEGSKVLLVDSDFRKPAIYKIFEIAKDEVNDLPAVLRTGEGIRNIITKKLDISAWVIYILVPRLNPGRAIAVSIVTIINIRFADRDAIPA